MYNIAAYLPGVATAGAKTKNFESKMMAKYPTAVLDQFQVGMYDSVWAMAEAIKQANTVTDMKAIRDKLAALKFEGARGTISFDQDRMPSPSAYLIQVKNGKSVAVN
jgi:ABC-type branched-subunit amino acid transport system substrate-binding protein